MINIKKIVGIGMLSCIILPLLYLVIINPLAHQFIIGFGVMIFLATWVYIATKFITGG